MAAFVLAGAFERDADGDVVIEGELEAAFYPKTGYIVLAINNAPLQGGTLSMTVGESQTVIRRLIGLLRDVTAPE